MGVECRVCERGGRMNLKETTLADVMHYMSENKTSQVDVDFEINGLKARLEIELVSRDEDDE